MNMITVGKTYKFSLPPTRNHICQVQAMEVLDKNRNKFLFDREIEKGIKACGKDDAKWEQLYSEIAGKYQYQLVICQRTDNGTPILAFGDDLIEVSI